MKNVKAIGFDLFNTLITVDSLALSEAEGRLTESLLESGLSIDREPFITSHRRWARCYLETTRNHGRETHNRFWINAALMEAGFSLGPEDPRISRAVNAYFSSFVDRAGVIPGTFEMIESVSRYFRVGLLSNFTHGPAAREILAVTGLEQYFGVTVISGEVGFRKPHRMVFDRLVEQLGVAHHQSIYVGDDPEPDITGAIGAGLQPVWTTYVKDHGLAYVPGYLEREQGRNYHVPRISNWDELFEILGV